MGIAAPAHKLATEGVYGNDLYRGFYRTEALNYEYMPLYPLLVAASYKVFGLGVWQARLVSMLCGLATILLTFQLGRTLYHAAFGLTAAAALCLMSLGVDPYMSGIPLLDLARVIRYDILVPVFVLGACLVFCWAENHDQKIGYLGAGFLVGLATLTHLYGAFILLPFAVLLLWQNGWRVILKPALYLLGLAWILCLVPWLLYVGIDPAAYEGQMLRHAERFHLFDPGFLLWNLTHEHWRYLTWVGGSFHQPILWPRLGIWLLPIALTTTTILLWRKRRTSQLADRFILVTLPVLALALALLLNLKRYPYLILILPFMALQVANAMTAWWRHGRLRWLLGLLVAGLMIESGSNVVHNLQVARSTTDYQRLTAAIAAEIPADARLLIAQTYWLGLADYDTLSLNLPFVLSDPHYRYRFPDTPSMEAVMQEIDPDYIVIEHYFLDEYFRDPNSWLNPEVVRRWERFNAYFTTACRVVATFPAADYGQTDLFQCQTDAQSSNPIQQE